MMMNDFGLPMTDADINMAANPVKADLQMKLSTTGVVNNWGFAAAGLGLGVGSSIFGGIRGASAARRQAELQNEAMMRQYQYDMKRWQMSKHKLIADRAQAVEEITIQKRNQNKQLDYTDAMNARQYQYDLQIRNSQQQSLNDQFTRSEDIYASQTDLNAMSAQTAYEEERNALNDIRTELIFDRKDAYLDSLIKEGQLRAMGMQGRSARKGYQVTASDFGRQITQLNLAFAGAGRNSRAAMAAIANDYASADLAAYAERMLEPGEIPLPLEQMKVVRPEFAMPRALGSYDFGPAPVMGGWTDPSAAAGRVWGQTISSIGGQFGNWLGGWSKDATTGKYSWSRG